MKVVMNGDVAVGVPARAYVLDPIAVARLDVVGAIDALRSGLPVGWTMEPGDMTRYRLIIVPLWTGLDLRYAAGDGGIPEAGNRWLYVAKCGEGGAAVMPFCGPWDFEDQLRNAWSRRLISALVRGIWALIDNPDLDPATYVFDETPPTVG